MRGLWAASFCTALWVAASVPTPSQAASPLRDTGGGLHDPSEWLKAPAAVLFFVTTDCPIANSYVPEMNRLHERFAARGVRFFGVQADVSIAGPEVAAHAREFHYGFPMLLDPLQELVILAGATVTPQAAVIVHGKVVYLGRIDDRVADFGKQRYQATRHDLADALEAVLAGRPVEHPTTRAIGCAINRVQASMR